MDDKVKALVKEHWDLVKVQGDNLKYLARLNRDFDNWKNKKDWEIEYRETREAIDNTRNRTVEIMAELYELAGLPREIK